MKRTLQLTTTALVLLSLFAVVPQLQLAGKSSDMFRVNAMAALSTIQLPAAIAPQQLRQAQNKPTRQQTQTVPANDSSSSSSSSSASSSSSSSPYAYVFLLGGVDPEQPAYRGHLYSIWVLVYALRNFGSKADFVLYVKMMPHVTTVTTTTTLPEREERVLRDMNIHVHYLPSTTATTTTTQQQQGQRRPPPRPFHDLMMDKFIVLSLTQYRKVLYLDSDIMPVNCFDYLFEAPFLQENYVVATNGEPSNGGFFMLSPHEGDYEEHLNIIQRQQASIQNRTDIAADLSFDVIPGWGHEIQPPDHWNTARVKGKGTQWVFYGAASDQGFLYYWTKYHKKSVSIQWNAQVKNWGTTTTHGGTDAVLSEQVLDRPFDSLHHHHHQSSCISNWTLKSTWENCARRPGKPECAIPHRDYVHLAGKLKPWRAAGVGIPNNNKNNGAVSVENSTASPAHYWFYLLNVVNEKYNVGIDWEHWDEEKKLYDQSPLGFKPEYYHPNCGPCNIPKAAAPKRE